MSKRASEETMGQNKRAKLLQQPHEKLAKLYSEPKHSNIASFYNDSCVINWKKCGRDNYLSAKIGSKETTLLQGVARLSVYGSIYGDYNPFYKTPEELKKLASERQLQKPSEQEQYLNSITGSAKVKYPKTDINSASILFMIEFDHPTAAALQSSLDELFSNYSKYNGQSAPEECSVDSKTRYYYRRPLVVKGIMSEQERELYDPVGLIPKGYRYNSLPMNTTDDDMLRKYVVNGAPLDNVLAAVKFRCRETMTQKDKILGLAISIADAHLHADNYQNLFSEESGDEEIPAFDLSS